MVVVRFSSTANPPLNSIQLTPASVGISVVDEILESIPSSQLQPFLTDRHANPSASRDRLERTFVLWFSDELDPDSVVTLLSSLSEFEQVRVERYQRVHFFGTKRHIPPDDRFDDQWNLDSAADDRQDIDAPEAWEIERGDPSVIIAITDTGTMVDTTGGEPWRFHSDLQKFVNSPEDVHGDNIMGYDDVNRNDSAADADFENDNVIGYNFSPPKKGTPFERAVWASVPFNALLRDPAPWNIFNYYPHGLSVASIAASKEGAVEPGVSSVCGVAPQCEVYQVRTSLTPDPDHPFDPEDLILLASPTLDAAVISHAAMHSQVMNMSWGFDFLTEEAEELLHDAVKTATDPIEAGGYDCVLVAAVGNASEVDPDLVVAPARFPEVVGVGNMTKTLGLFYDSVYGPQVGDVSVVAPVDEGIPAATQTQCASGYPCPVDEEVNDHFGGTSAASPQVAGLAALIRSRFPNYGQAEVVDRVIRSAEWYWSDPRSQEDLKKFGSGKINAYRALTEWGEISADITWTASDTRDGKYYVSGDLTIKSGATLTIDAGVVVRIAPDHEQKGADAGRVEIVVESGGTLNIVGSASGRVKFESFKTTASAANDWIGIKYEAGSAGMIAYTDFKNAQRAIENYAPITLTDCSINACETAIDAHANVSLTKCTLAGNAVSAAVANGGSTLTISKCVTAFNGGPAVRIVSGTATMSNSIVYQNASAAGSRTDAQWETDGVVVHNMNPAFCDTANGDYRLYAFSPASAPAAPYTGYFGERVGAYDVGCVPPSTVTAVSSQPIQDLPGLVVACPKGDKASLVVTVDLNGTITRDISWQEIVLDVGDCADAVSVFDQGYYVEAQADAVGPDYLATITHSYFGGYGVNDVDILLNGYALSSYALQAKAHFEIRSMDISGDGVVNVVDYATFGSHYTSPPKSYAANCDYSLPEGTITLQDFTTFGSHYNHERPAGYHPLTTDPVESNAGVTLQFTEEFPTANAHRLYVDVGAENFPGIAASVFSMQTGSSRLSLVGWLPSDGSIGTVMFAPVIRDGADELFYGVKVSESFTDASAPLGRLVFDVSGEAPFELTGDNFVLTVGDVLVGDPGDGPVVAAMGGEFTRTFDPAVARIYHDRLEQNFPNPFNPTTTLAYSLKSASNVNITIFDVAGRRVRELVNERHDRGTYKIVWDGRNDSGAIVSSGVYFYKMKAGSFRETKKMTILK